MKRSLMSLLACPVVLMAQADPDPPRKFKEEICPTIDNMGGAAHGPRMNWNPTPVYSVVEKANRLDVSSFGVVDKAGRLATIREQRGKIVVLGFWHPLCPGAMTQLNELLLRQTGDSKKDILYWPIHLENWGPALSLIRKELETYKGSKVFVPGQGSNGLHVLGAPITTFPMIYVIDRQGRVAASYSGYREGRLVKLLGAFYAETD